MQLHACLLLFIITTDEALAFSPPACGGSIVLHQEPAGHIRLASPGLHSLDPTNQPPDETPPAPVCTWTISVPKGRAVLLKLAWADGGSSVYVRCSRNEDDGVLEVGGTALLSGCDGDKVSLSWTGAGHFSTAAQLSYFVQESPSASSEFRSGPRSGRDLVPQTGPGATRTASTDREVLRGTQGGGGRLYGGLEEWTSGPWFASSPSSQGQGPAAPLQGLSAAGRADRETIPFPEEEPNNRAETSGAARFTDGPTFAGERTRPYFQRALGTGTPLDASRPTSSETSSETPPTLMGSEHETASSPDITPGAEGRKYTVTQAPELTETTPPAASGSSIPGLASAPPERASWAPRDGGTISGAVSAAPGETPPDLWRSQRSTDRLQTSTVTSDPAKSQTEPRHADTEPTPSSPSQGPGGTRPATAYATALDTTVGATEAVLFHQTDSFASDATSLASELASSGKSENKEGLRSPPPHTSSSFTRASREETQTAAEGTQRHSMKRSGTDDNPSSSPDGTGVPDWTLAGSFTPEDARTTGSSTDTEIYTQSSTLTLSRHPSPTNSPTPAQHASSSASIRSSAPSDALMTRTAFPGSSHFPHTASPSPSTAAESTVHKPLTGPTAGPGPSQTSTVAPASTHAPPTQNRPPLPPPAAAPVTPEQTGGHGTPARTSLPPRTTAGPGRSHGHRGAELEKEEEEEASHYSSAATRTPAAGSPRQPPPRTDPHPNQESRVTLAPPAVTAAATWSAAASRTPPKFYVVPDEPAAIRVESIELLLQIVVEESRSAFTSGLEEDATAWLEPYLQRAPGFSRLLAVWSSGHAVQSLLEFKTSGALRWLDTAGPASLLERTGLAQAVRDGRSLGSSRITNVTLGGLQGDVCDWLLQCPAGYRCVSQAGTSNYSCSSLCHFDHCHHHGICTHHPGQFPVCRCLVGEDFWYMGQRCDTRMTHARLVGTCLAILLIVVIVIGVLAFVAVRRYRAILIQAKVDQTRSSYRRFNHFDELSGRFWLRSWAGSADSLDNPAFTRSNELLHLRTLDRPCCYHDDTLSLASTCPSHGARINTVYLHSSQYGWRGSEMSLGDGVLDSGKASDLSVCSWPVEPIHWTPFPLLQQLASHRTPAVRVSRPRSYCEGMELVDLGKSWTA